MKRLLPLLFLLFPLFAACSAQTAFAGENTVELVYYYQGDVVTTVRNIEEGTLVDPISYTTTKNALNTQGKTLPSGTVFRWEKEDGTPVLASFPAENVSLYWVPVETNVTCRVSYRYDQVSETRFSEKTIVYPYGYEYVLPEEIDGKKIEDKLYASPLYDEEDNGRLNIPTYLENDYVVYAKLLDPAVVTVDEEELSLPYGEILPTLDDKENFSFVGYFTDVDLTHQYTGVAVNGLHLFTSWERTSYTVTAITENGEEKIVVPVENGVITEDALPENHVWTDENGEVVFPLPIENENVVLHGEKVTDTATNAKRDAENKKSTVLSAEENAAVILVAAAFLCVALFFVLERLFKKKTDTRSISEKALRKYLTFLGKISEKIRSKDPMHKPFKEKCNIFRFDEPYAKKNVFKKQLIKIVFLPKYRSAASVLPRPVWDGHEDFIKCYDYAWQIAFKNLKNPRLLSRFKSPFIDTAFNGFSFMWDSSFMVMFGKYGVRAFNFQQTLDNFYACQHSDGYICRELWEKREGEQFNCYDPSSTGPNILPWAEWEYYKNTGDVERLKKVFDPLMAYHIWLRKNRTWRDGSYWSTGLGSGMDNQPRTPEGYHTGLENGHAAWADACFQMIISANVLIDIAKVIGREDETLALQKERDRLTKFVNEKLWNEEDAFYYDLWQDEDGNDVQNKVKSIGAYWALLAGVVPEEKIARFVSHLDNEKEFKRPNRVPSLSADHPLYNKENGNYWLGGVWASTNYMVIRGLQAYGYHDMAREIALSSVTNVVEVFKKTGTLWENYSPETASQGKPAKPKFVGWSGLFPITMLFEGIFGIEADAQNDRVIWRIDRTENHGVSRYPLSSGTADLLCTFKDGKPVVTVSAPFHAEVDVYYKGEFLYTAKSKKDRE